MASHCRHICLLVLVVFLFIDLTTVNAGRRDKDKDREREREKKRSRNERSRSRNKKQCYEIETDFCNDVVGYNMTRLPNAFGHKKLRHAERFLEEMAMVVETGCSPYLRAFLCSIYLPECPYRKKNDPLPPCRTLCEKVNILFS